MNESGAIKLPGESNRFQVDEIFKIKSEHEFANLVREVFTFQYSNNCIYQDYCDALGVVPETLRKPEEVPFIPISFFRTHSVKSFEGKAQKTFISSGTLSNARSRHEICDIGLYERAFMSIFEQTYGDIKQYCLTALLPSYLENADSSLLFMVETLIRKSDHPRSSFFTGPLTDLRFDKLESGRKHMLIGVSYALLDLAEIKPEGMEKVIVIETGGMKGKRPEIPKAELHAKLKKGLNVKEIHSEYGMAELMSQAYSTGAQIFRTAPWMRVFVRETHDPLNVKAEGSGLLNIIDLANVYSCAFIATEDLGKVSESGFEIFGRADGAELRGCNMLIDS